MFGKFGSVLEGKLKEKATQFVQQQSQQFLGGKKPEAQQEPQYNNQYNNNNYQQPQHNPGQVYNQQQHNDQQQNYQSQYNQPQYNQGQPSSYTQNQQYNQPQQYGQDQQYNQGQPFNPPQSYNQGQQFNQPQHYNQGQPFNPPQSYNQDQQFNQHQGYNQGQQYSQPQGYNQGSQYQPQQYNQGRNQPPQYDQGFNQNPPQAPNDGQGHSIAPANTSFVQGNNQGGAYQGQVHGENISVSNCRGRKKALFIGINYFGTSSELRGCINDVHNVKDFLFNRFGFSEQGSIILTDDQKDPSKIPTRQNIIQGFRWLVEGASMGDSLFLHFSGHGGSIEDEDGDEVDGFDETIYPVDHERAGVIVDDEIHAICVKNLPAGVRLTAVFDCCHSGTVMDLPFTYKCDGEIEVICQDSRKEAAMSLLKAGLSYSRG
ncbi:hypothetical protein K7432_004391 [Basidiobolus ranarum]